MAFFTEEPYTFMFMKSYSVYRPRFHVRSMTFNVAPRREDHSSFAFVRTSAQTVVFDSNRRRLLLFVSF